MARLTVDYEDGFDPAGDAINVLCGLEIIKHLRRTEHGADAESHIGTMHELLEPVLGRLCECDVVPEASEAKAA